MAESARITHVTDASFEQEVLGHSGVTVVDFWAEWCGPCRMIAPILEELARDFDGRIRVAKVDVDANPIIAERYGIRSIPTLAVFKDGKVIDAVVGAQPKPALAARFEKHAPAGAPAAGATGATA